MFPSAMTMKYTRGRVFTLFTVYFVLVIEKQIVFANDLPQIINMGAYGEIGSNSTISCQVVPADVEMKWLFKGKHLLESDRIKISNETRSLPERDSDGNPKLFKEFRVSIDNTTSSETGNYTCLIKYQDKDKSSYKILDLSFHAELVSKNDTMKKSIGENATLTCVFKVYENREVRWLKVGVPESSVVLKSVPRDLKHVISKYEIHDIKRSNNGTYLCFIWDMISNKTIKGSIDLLVLAEPQVQIQYAKSIGAHKIYLTWTVNNGNLPITKYVLFYKGNNSNSFIYAPQRIDVDSTSVVIDGLEPSTSYQLLLEAHNDKGKSTVHKYHLNVTTAEKDINFVPNITINGFSATSVTIGWVPPPENVTTEIENYELEARKKNETEVKKAYHPRDNGNLPYMFQHLEPYSTYYFRVRACPHKDHCWNWTSWMEAITLDGTPGKPEDVKISCYEDDVNIRHMNLSWSPPLKPNAEIKGYEIELTEKFTYIDHFGIRRNDTWGPRTMFVTNVTVRFDNLKPNTNYTVRLSAVTRTRRRGDEQVRFCITEPGPPDNPPRASWRKFFQNNNYFFKVDIPRVNERNGPIYCYRVYMVRLNNKLEWRSLQPPENLRFITYDEAHDLLNPKIGAYITDIFTSKDYPPDSKLVMGDGETMFVKDLPAICKKKPVPRDIFNDIPPTTVPVITTTTEYLEAVPTTDSPQISGRRRRASYRTPHDKRRDKRNQADDISIYNILEEREHNYTASNMDNNVPRDDMITLKDDKLDPNSNYTMFVEVIVQVSKALGNNTSVYSDYLIPLVPAASPSVVPPINAIELALQITCGILALVLLGLIILCVIHTRRTRKMPPNAVEMNSLQATLRSLYQGLRGGRVPLVSSAPPDMPPIPREALAAAYADRQADSDYGFQQEFEMLPDCFADRTTYASEARENQPKNRYPDIKAYDQTRVRLSQIDSIVGSDYINANYVMGYKEPKKFICAQGPTDTTVNDFWRMIWEHGLELIVMLTNLEEYSKVKCSKYWPDEIRGVKQFGAITVQHVSEKRYSDYIVRDLKITKQPTNAEGQPIIENNGIPKRNGVEGKDSPSGSVPTSPRELKESTGQNGTGPVERLVRQYHFLVWKDFAAPEHPHSILKFIKRVDEAWSQLMGRPVVVHCSAGVGRTGTLVALDYLLQQLKTENQVSVFNTIAELRRQRNFLVQSLKQYVFVYRALVEYAHYGDTEIPASRLKASIDRLRNTPEGADKCLMEEEFERMISSPVKEGIKSCAAGAAEELRARNRSDDCLPYDRNRVILTPIPNKEFSTYINASFIEAYDNSEGFIITQDPLPGTIADFWRMISEHNVSTIVMLSELGDGERKCPRYWDDAVAQYEHMSVQYEHSESCPYYTRREFRLTNTKTGDVTCVRQLQYHGWPTVPGQVPEVTRGLAEVADAADPVARLAPGFTQGPMLVHCHLGTERSSMFVALCVLVCQLRAERRVDVGCVTRKVRTQRAHTIDTFLQYEFLHRAILNYAELHNLLDDS